MSGVACNHLLWEAQTVRRRRAWHAITALGQHTWSDDVERGMPSLPLDSTHGRMTWAWYVITALGLHAWTDYVGRGMTSLPLDSTHGRTTHCMA